MSLAPDAAECKAARKDQPGGKKTWTEPIRVVRAAIEHDNQPHLAKGGMLRPELSPSRLLAAAYRSRLT